MNYMEEINYCKFNVSKNQYYIQLEKKKISFLKCYWIYGVFSIYVRANYTWTNKELNIVLFPSHPI